MCGERARDRDGARDSMNFSVPRERGENVSYLQSLRRVNKVSVNKITVTPRSPLSRIERRGSRGQKGDRQGVKVNPARPGSPSLSFHPAISSDRFRPDAAAARRLDALPADTWQTRRANSGVNQ